MSSERTTEEQVDDYLHALVHCDNPQLRQELRETLVALGTAAVPRLLELLAWEHPVVHDIRAILLRQARGPVLLVVLERLARLQLTGEQAEDSRLLAQVKPDRDFFKEALAQVATNPRYDDLPVLVRVLEEVVGDSVPGSLLYTEVPLAVQAILRLAETDPRPELRVVLPLLRVSSLTLFSLLPARRRLLRLLRKAHTLPLPAHPKSPPESLPRPSNFES